MTQQAKNMTVNKQGLRPAAKPTVKHLRSGGLVTSRETGEFRVATPNAHAAIMEAKFGPADRGDCAAWVRCGSGWRQVC